MSKTDKFIELFRNLYMVSCIENDPDERIETGDFEYVDETEEVKKKFLFFTRTIKVPSIKRKMKAVTKATAVENIINEYLDLFEAGNTYYDGSTSVFKTKEPVSFDLLWGFCEFVKRAEYVIMYPNNKDNDVYVEASSILFNKESDPDEVRKIFIYTDTICIAVALERIDDHYVTKQIMDTIKIRVVRKYSAEANDDALDIVCVDNLGYDDNISDIDNMHINSISNTIYDYCYNTFKNIVNTMIKDTGVKLE